MKKKIILKRIFHRNKWRYAIIFDKDWKLIELTRSIPGTKWSQTNICWYTDCNESVLKKIITVFKEAAEIDISAIVSDTDTKAVSSEQEFSQDEELQELVDKATGDEDETDTSSGTEDKFFSDIPYPVTISTIQGKDDLAGQYGPVRFSINEPDGRLIIKFLGKYDPDWIKELKSYRRTFYDEERKEWYIRWSKMTVDSLSDYFSSRGVAVIIIKKEVSPLIKEKRLVRGSEIRDRQLPKVSSDAIDKVKKYLEEKRYSIRTISSYTAHLELFFKYYHDKKPGDIDAGDISAFVEEHIIRLGYSASYQNIIISAIKMYYTLSKAKRLNLESIERPRRSKALPKVFSKEEVMKIFNATRNNKHKLILWLIYSCGLRRSEVTKIKLIDLDRERGILHIREAKGNIDRQVPIAEKVWEKIRLYIKDYKPATWLFEGQMGGRYSVESVYSVFKQSLKRAGIKKDVGVHCLRHSYATHLHESGLDIRYIQELLGHKSTRTTEIYTHVSRRNLFAIRSPIEDMEIG